MRTISQIRWAAMLLAGICLSQSGCSLVGSQNPLVAPGEARLDERLCGAWRWERTSGEFVYMHIGSAGNDFPAGVMRAIMVGGPNNIPEVEQYLFLPATIGDVTYINGVILPKDETTDKWKPDRIKGYLIFKCRVEKDTATLFISPDKAVWDEAIKLKHVQAVRNKESFDVTDSTDELRRFFAASGGKLFEEKDSSTYVFHRVK